LIGLMGGIYIFTEARAALYGTLATMLMLPFGTFPVKIILTPTLLDITLGAFVLVYLLQWVTGRRTLFRFTWVHSVVLIYMLYFVLAFALGLRYGAPTNNTLRQFAETLLAISLIFILVDLIRDAQTLRRLIQLIILLVGVQAVLAIVLWLLPDAFAERQLIRLARIGYPNGGVIRYVEDNRELPERAIGTWVDPNVLGGALAIFASMITPQLFARKPVLPYRWLTFGIWGAVIVAMLLTFSRAALVGYTAGLLLMATLRYRQLFYVMGVGLVLLLFLPQTQFYVQRFTEAFAGREADPATLMRLGEYGDSIELIRQYPLFGVGFTGTPTSDLYTSVASMYLIIANQMGLIGLSLFLLLFACLFRYGWGAWQIAQHNPNLDSILLGYHAAMLTVLTTSIADLYFYRLDFQSPFTLFWLTAALCLTSAKIAHDSQSSLAHLPRVL
ncbi:MAG: O-antigen ligase family protein, partial [Phototrophicaceae bacterium]